MSSVTIASSPVIKSFLSADPTTLTNEEVEDAQRREEADRTRDEGRKQFAKEVSARVDSLRNVVKGMKGDLLGRGHYYFPRSLTSKSDHPTDGLTRMFAVIKTTDSVRDLPPEFKAAIEWGRISLVIHHWWDGFPLIFLQEWLLPFFITTSRPMTDPNHLLDWSVYMGSCRISCLKLHWK
jgi:hypothetical protein